MVISSPRIIDLVVSVASSDCLSPWCVVRCLWYGGCCIHGLVVTGTYYLVVQNMCGGLQETEFPISTNFFNM